jgi:Tfp pilus assembly protein PilF
VKKVVALTVLLIGAWSCVTYQPAPPSFYIEDIPSSLATRLTLDERIAAVEAWKSLREGRTDQARKLLLGLGQDSPLYAAGLGYVDFAMADLGAAETNFKESLSRFSDLTLADVGLAQIYEARGQKDQAFSEYREILKKDPGNRWAGPRFQKLQGELVDASFAEAKAALAAGNREAEKRALLKVLFYDPESVRAHLELVRIYREEKNTPALLLHLKAASEARPGDKAVLREYAEYLYDAGEFGRSLDLYEKVAEIDPQDKAVAARIEELKNKLGVFELPSQYALIPDLDSITREDLAALISVKFKDFFKTPARTTEILVDISMSWAQRFIIDVASRGVMSVYDNHTFQPKRVINRAEMADSVSRLVGFLEGRGVKFVPLLDVRKIQIADVAPDNYYYQPILKVVSLQIMALAPGMLFEPERIVTGREAVMILDVVAGLAR